MGADHIPGYVVGGFIEMTVLSRDHVESFIAHRWPNEIGRAADPSQDPKINFVDASSGART
ncbi:hypothetical protein C0214_05775 [Methylobacterium sp. DM1]|nr:hypothetical protein C0214_05775 [Methylobacterium sp. DM1]